MRVLPLCAVLIGACIALNLDGPSGDVFAVLVAGSNGFDNYRHQADVAHAYHVLRNHGVKEENIIVMMYDDVANDPENPYPGKLYNNPDLKVDYYAGLQIDYRGDDVTPSNFAKILTGDRSVVGGNGRVLESGSNDRVFVYFTDHGDSGIVYFPNTVMTAVELNNALKTAHDNGKFGTMVFYVEACHSGSMFHNIIPDDLNIFVVTAAGDNENSWAAYCDMVEGIVCLGDFFSVSWMEDSDKEDLRSETIGDQVTLVTNETTTSHVHIFGDKTIEQDPVGWFQGMEKDALARRQLSEEEKQARVEQRRKSAISAPEIKATMLRRRIMKDPSDTQALDALIELEKKNVAHKVHMEVLARRLPLSKITIESLTTATTPVLYHVCHHKAIKAFAMHCGAISEAPNPLYAKTFNNACNALHGDHRPIITAMREHCLNL